MKCIEKSALRKEVMVEGGVKPPRKS